MITIWRLLGHLPRAKTREEIRAQSIDGWSPWRFVWSLLDETAIIVPDPRNLSRSCHVPVSEAGPPGSAIKFAALLRDDFWWFYIPAMKGDHGAFDAGTPQYEGFWRQHIDEASELPWPNPIECWSGRTAFLEALKSVEAVAEREIYRGISLCRVCGCPNGHAAYRFAEWEWPEGFRHYVEQHQVQPSAEFVAFISAGR